MSPSISIDSDDWELEALLRQLETLVRGEGADLHPALRVVSREGNLWIESDAQDGEVLVRLPPESLIPIDEASLRLDGSAIRVEACSDKISAAQKALLDCMLAIYNQGNKLELHRGYSPWSAFCSSQELLDQLHFARKDAPKISEYHEMASQGDLDALLLQHYIASRTLRYGANQGDPSGPFHRVLMPFIDFFNHHTAAPGFSRDGAALEVRAGRSVPGSNECFVSYSRLDAMDSFLSYGFVDSSAAFMRSVPVHIRLRGVGEIEIQGRGAVTRKNPPPTPLADLKPLVPPFTKRGDAYFILGGLIIPGPQAILAMHRILAFVIQRFLAPNASQQQLVDMTDDSVEQVLVANEDYFAALADTLGRVGGQLADTPALAQLRQLIVLQQQKLQDARDALSRFRQKGKTLAGSAGWMARAPIS